MFKLRYLYSLFYKILNSYLDYAINKRIFLSMNYRF